MQSSAIRGGIFKIESHSAMMSKSKAYMILSLFGIFFFVSMSIFIAEHYSISPTDLDVSAITMNTLKELESITKTNPLKENPKRFPSIDQLNLSYIGSKKTILVLGFVILICSLNAFRNRLGSMGFSTHSISFTTHKLAIVALFIAAVLMLTTNIFFIFGLNMFFNSKYMTTSGNSHGISNPQNTVNATKLTLFDGPYEDKMLIDDFHLLPAGIQIFHNNTNGGVLIFQVDLSNKENKHIRNDLANLNTTINFHILDDNNKFWIVIELGFTLKKLSPEAFLRRIIVRNISPYIRIIMESCKIANETLLSSDFLDQIVKLRKAYSRQQNSSLFSDFSKGKVIDRCLSFQKRMKDLCLNSTYQETMQFFEKLKYEDASLYQHFIYSGPPGIIFYLYSLANQSDKLDKLIVQINKTIEEIELESRNNSEILDMLDENYKAMNDWLDMFEPIQMFFIHYDMDLTRIVDNSGNSDSKIDGLLSTVYEDKSLSEWISNYHQTFDRLCSFACYNNTLNQLVDEHYRNISTNLTNLQEFYTDQLDKLKRLVILILEFQKNVEEMLMVNDNIVGCFEMYQTQKIRDLALEFQDIKTSFFSGSDDGQLAKDIVKAESKKNPKNLKEFFLKCEKLNRRCSTLQSKGALTLIKEVFSELEALNN